MQSKRWRFESPDPLNQRMGAVRNFLSRVPKKPPSSRWRSMYGWGGDESLQPVYVPKEVECPDCGSKHIHKCSDRMTRYAGKVKRFHCQDCGRYFQENTYGRITQTNEYEVVVI